MLLERRTTSKKIARLGITASLVTSLFSGTSCAQYITDEEAKNIAIPEYAATSVVQPPSSEKQESVIPTVPEKTATESEGREAIVSGINKAMNELGYPEILYKICFDHDGTYSRARFDVVAYVDTDPGYVDPADLEKYPSLFEPGRQHVGVAAIIRLYPNREDVDPERYFRIVDSALCINYMTKGETEIEPYAGPMIHYFRLNKIYQSEETTPSFIEETVYNFVIEELKEIEELDKAEKAKWSKMFKEYRER